MIKILCLICLFSGSVFAQTTEEKIVESLDSFSLARPQEKAYLQTDKSTYLAGETIWLKTYVTLLEKPGILSKIVYVTLSDLQGKVLQKKMLKLNNGTATTGMDLDRSLAEGNYMLQCYTLWMLNFPDFIQQKKIVIFNNVPAKVEKKSPAQPSVKIDFFPEGGNLVANVRSIVAFKIRDLKTGSFAKGSIVDRNNKVIASFQAMHNGMGYFEFTPLMDEAYTAIMEFNEKEKFSLPEVINEGVVIKADNSHPTKTFVRVERSEKNKQAYNELILVAQQHNKVVYMARLNINEGQDAVTIRKNNLPPGIMQISILSSEGHPLAERIVFVANHIEYNSITTEINKDKSSKNRISFDASLFNGLDAAVSIVNADADGIIAEDNIQSHLLLTSDLKGNIQYPAQYFKDKSELTIRNLDLIMLTNGWRRFKWNEIMAKQYSPIRYPFETSLSITGKVFQANGKTPLKDGRINLIIKGEDSTQILAEAKLNAAGFIVDNIDFMQSATVYYQGTNMKKEKANVSVAFNPVYMDTLKYAVPGIDKSDTQPSETPVAMKKMMLDKKGYDSTGVVMLKNILLRSKKLSQTDSLNLLYASPLFENSDQTLMMDEGNYFDIWQYLQRMVPGILIDKTESEPKVNFSRYSGMNVFSGSDNNTVQLYLNEVPVSASIIDVLNPADVGIIKVYKGVTGIALGADRGAIALYTVKGKHVRDWRDKGFDFIKKTGYSTVRQFLEIDYSKVNFPADYPDVRATLYWNPSIKIVNGKADIIFYNDERAKRFSIRIEGIDRDGKLLHTEIIE